jgi:hypothetical protein
MTRERLWWTAGLIGLGAFVFGLLVVGSLGQPRAEVDPLRVDEVLVGGSPAERYGTRELQVVGWYAEIADDCDGDRGGADESIAWLQADCPLRVLLAEQPESDVNQAELERDGLRLAAPVGRPFPARPEPGGVHVMLQPLVFTGHFDDEAAARCVPERMERCRNTFVVSDSDGFVR